MSLLGKINNPDDLRKLSVDQLPEVCRQLREDIVREVSVNPGHLASSLGVVELTVALHYVYDTPEDRIVWDVGHQAYGHKILTGRRDKFSTNRKLHGIKPFPSPEESVYDTFECGHASNSISAALGMAVANKNEVDRGADRQRHVVAVIGDGAMSGGLAFEGLNNVSQYPNDTLIILNDNNMSIDLSVGGMKQYLLGLNTNETYNALRFKVSQWLHSRGYLEEDRRKGIMRLSNALKSAISHQQNIFEGLNIRYFGPFDGHNIKELVRILRQLKNLSGPKLLHLHTVKGKGYAPAEKTPQIWHAPGKFDVDTGERILEHKPGQPLKYQVVFGRTLLELAKQNPKIVGITPAMPSGCSLNIMMKEIPERTFDVGIAEGHAATFAGGMAKEGLVPFCNIYSAFAQRAYDNIIHDVAILNLHVVFCFDRAGLVGEDGPTHHGAFDIASLRPVPNLTICSPMDEWELRRLMFTAQLDGMGPWVIRYPRGCGVKEEWKCPLEKVEPGTGRKLKDGDDLAVLTLGPIGNDVAEAIAETEGSGKTTKTAAHYDMRFVKPLDEKLLDEIGRKFKVVVTVEDGARNGGFGSAVMEWLQDHGYHTMVKRIGLPDHFVEHGTIAELREIIGMDNASIVNTIYK
ncbi:MAG: 1-deoxy-D-xylulose-5-phosphate synthase [Prevotella sp.]|nr:1-deoxy-D-xylulose-5-phosphate synthase [Prevotellaceae bacterium]MDY5344626.1 1-deoxy-D-xylulose-5-phosphate synthase [Prevotella sp.]